MSNVIDNIVNCQISIDTPIQDSSSFGTIMLIGYAPKAASGEIKPVNVYGYLEDVLSAGWGEDTTMYAAARAAFSQNPKPKEIYVLLRQKTDGVAEEITEAVKRALDVPGWYGLALVDVEEDGEYDSVADLIETTEKIFGVCTAEKQSPLINRERMRTFIIHSVDSYANVAWMAKCFQFDPGSESWAYKTLAGIRPSELSNTEMRNLEDNGLNYYITCAGKNITRNGRMAAGEWIDVIRFRDWLKNQMQLKIYSLFVSSAKIPYTDAGITLVENQMEAVLKAGQRAGGIAETEYDADDNPVHGYSVTVPKAADLSSQQRTSRVLTGAKFTARLTGAIHVVELIGSLVY